MDGDRLWRPVKVFTPFAVLLIVLLILNFGYAAGTDLWAEALAGRATVVPEAAAERAAETGSPAGGDAALIATAIAGPLAEPTVVAEETATPAIMPSFRGPIAALVGPPAGSLFSLSAPLTFYWYAEEALELAKGQTMGLFLVGDGGETLVGEMNEPNLGTGYQLAFSPEAHGLPAGAYYWQVRLLDGQQNVALAWSEEREIRFIARD